MRELETKRELQRSQIEKGRERRGTEGDKYIARVTKTRGTATKF